MVDVVVVDVEVDSVVDDVPADTCKYSVLIFHTEWGHGMVLVARP